MVQSAMSSLQSSWREVHPAADASPWPPCVDRDRTDVLPRHRSGLMRERGDERMTLYAIRPVPGTGSLDEDAEVVDQSRYGWQFLEQAVTLWRLVDSSYADEIEAIIDRATLAAGDGELRFYQRDLHELVHLLTGIDNAVDSGSSASTGASPWNSWRSWPRRCQPWISRPTVRFTPRQTLSLRS